MTCSGTVSTRVRRLVSSTYEIRKKNIRHIFPGAPGLSDLESSEPPNPCAHLPPNHPPHQILKFNNPTPSSSLQHPPAFIAQDQPADR